MPGETSALGDLAQMSVCHLCASSPELRASSIGLSVRDDGDLPLARSRGAARARSRPESKLNLSPRPPWFFQPEFDPDLPALRQYYVVCQRDRLRSPMLQAFLDWLSNEMNMFGIK
jgi:hypothetical protein